MSAATSCPLRNLKIKSVEPPKVPIGLAILIRSIAEIVAGEFFGRLVTWFCSFCSAFMTDIYRDTIYYATAILRRSLLRMNVAGRLSRWPLPTGRTSPSIEPVPRRTCDLRFGGSTTIKPPRRSQIVAGRAPRCHQKGFSRSWHPPPRRHDYRTKTLI